MTTENWIDLNDIQAVAIAQSKGWEIQWSDRNFDWGVWFGQMWNENRKFRGRPRQPHLDMIAKVPE